MYAHRGHQPLVHPSAYVAPTAVLCGNVHVEADVRILFGAVITAEDGQVSIGRRCVVMENALVRGRAGHPAEVGDDVLIGPHAHINGATIANGCFLATGCSLFPGARLGRHVEVRVNAVVHTNTTLAAETTVPIGWVAVGDPAQILPPARHDDIWAVLKPLDFPGTVYGADRDAPPAEMMASQSRWYGAHLDDRPI
jgi:carbonic anhydrase/acetyltransferase-like protein (isoleucine patch superfamily)